MRRDSERLHRIGLWFTEHGVTTGRERVVPAILLSVNLRKRFRVRIIGMLSMALLFAQLAVAAYACPAMSIQADPGSPSMAGMPCAEMVAAGVQLDPEQPALCMQHCQFGSVNQAVDHVSPAFAPATALPALFTVSVADRLDSLLRAWAEVERLRDRPPPLAHSVAHCCYRI